MCMVEEGEPAIYTTEIPVPVGAKCGDCGASDPTEGVMWVDGASGCVLLVNDEPRAWHEDDESLEGDWQFLSDWMEENGEPAPDFVPARALDTSTAYRCGRCKEAARWLTEVCNGYLWGGIREDIIEHWVEDTLYRNHAFGRLVLAAKKSWRNRHGELLTAEQVRVLVDNALARDMDDELPADANNPNSTGGAT